MDVKQLIKQLEEHKESQLDTIMLTNGGRLTKVDSIEIFNVFKISDGSSVVASDDDYESAKSELKDVIVEEKRSIILVGEMK